MKNIKELGLELIELDDQVLLVDKNKDLRNINDSKIWNYCPNSKFLFKGYQSHLDDAALEGRRDYPFEVLCSTKQLEGLPLLVIIEDELSEHEVFMIKAGISRDDINSWKKGFNHAKKTYKFTEDDFRNALSEAFKASQEGYQITSDEIIQSLSNKELWIEIEDKIAIDGHTIIGIEPKITEGKIKAIWK